MVGNYPGFGAEKELVLHADGVDIHARQRGAHPGAVFLHGFSGNLHIWDPLWEILDDDVGALRYDLRDFGDSRAQDEREFSHSDDLLAVLDSCAPEPVDLVGVSMGGAVALNFALDHPQRVRRLVLISPAITGWEWSEDWRALWRPDPCDPSAAPRNAGLRAPRCRACRARSRCRGGAPRPPW